MPKHSKIPNPLEEYFDMSENHSEAVDELRLSLYEAIAGMLENPNFDERHRKACLKLTLITYSIECYKGDVEKRQKKRLERN